MAERRHDAFLGDPSGAAAPASVDGFLAKRHFSFPDGRHGHDDGSGAMFHAHDGGDEPHGHGDEDGPQPKAGR